MAKDKTIFHIMCRDKLVADVVTAHNNLVISIRKYVEDSPIQPFWGDMEKASRQAKTMRFYRFLEGRCYEDSRADLQVILNQAKMTSNNPYEWVRVSHGVTYEDYFWIRFDDEEITWDDVKIRD